MIKLAYVGVKILGTHLFPNKKAKLASLVRTFFNFSRTDCYLYKLFLLCEFIILLLTISLLRTSVELWQCSCCLHTKVHHSDQTLLNYRLWCNQFITGKGFASANRVTCGCRLHVTLVLNFWFIVIVLLWLKEETFTLKWIDLIHR